MQSSSNYDLELEAHGKPSTWLPRGRLVEHDDFRKIFQVYNSDSIISNKLAQVKDSSDSRPHGFDVCRLLLGLLPRGSSLPRCRGPAHHMVCDGMVY